jgi:pimeloyl-ACP methyl ester carboxylesterase
MFSTYIRRKNPPLSCKVVRESFWTWKDCRSEALLTGPIALVWGTADPIMGPALRRHERELPRAAVTRTHAGHFLQEEAPAELAAAVEGVSRGAPPA